MPGIMTLARERGIKVVEDCAQAHGATIDGQQVGSFGDAAAFSFCQDKIITTGGEGGLLATSDSALWARAWAYKDHGKSYDAVYKHEHPPGFRWLHESFGTNWRMTEMQAAIGRVQLRKLPHWIATRRRNATLLMNTFATLPALRVPNPPSNVGHSYYRLYVFCRPEALRAGWSRDRIISELTAQGVPCFEGICSEIYREKAFDGADFRPPEALPVARELGETGIAFLVHPTLEPNDVDRIAAIAAHIITLATR
jgi:dTDP-4-amino-4,6-dideoxygalactose transaminase